MEDQTIEKIKMALEEIRPFLISDGGDIELVEVKDGKVWVRLIGACSNCSINLSTLKLGVEATVKKYVPEIKEVVSV
ncbi:MAG: NifU family protein [Flavobacteriaceae bacterium]|jgi:Fe-S cluster biogenesis protein NfuA|nr:NifU family protein [Flavobacteriaceae bacterium]